LEKAEIARKQKRYEDALEIFNKVKKICNSNMTLRDNLSFVISRLALCTYKNEKPNILESLVNAKLILEELKPNTSDDIEVLGLCGAINKRLYEETSKDDYIDLALFYYERGFHFKQDYYNAINVVFMLHLKINKLKNKDLPFDEIEIKAKYITNLTLEILLKMELEEQFDEKEDAVWVLYTIAEAYNYKLDTIKMLEYESKADLIAKKNNDDFAIISYNDQKVKISKFYDGKPSV
jgi:hypothetical protein